MQNSILRREIPLGSYSISLVQVVRIFEKMNIMLSEEADLEIATWTKREDQTDEEYEAFKQKVRAEAYRVTVSIYRDDNSHTYDDRKEIFDLAPNEALVSRIYMTNLTAFRRFAPNDPPNYFNLLLDFTQPPLLDANRITSSPTDNESSLTIGGARDGWIAGVEKVVNSSIKERHRIRAMLHKGFVYDYGLLAFGIPLSLYLCWLSVDFIHANLVQKDTVLGAAAFIYVFFVGLWLYRMLFGYTKWAFPLTELTEQKGRPKTHRRFWWSIIAAIGVKLAWDVFDLSWTSLLGLFR